MSFCSSSRRRGRPKLWRVLALASLVGGLALWPAAADFSGPDWRYAKSVTLPANLGADGWVELGPDWEVYAGAAPGLADLRIVRNQGDGGQEVAYAVVTPREQRVRQAFGATVRDLGHLPGQYTSLVADLGQPGHLHNEIEISTTSQNFQRQVSVEGSNDGATWAVLQSGTRIFDLTIKERSFTARNTRVPYPESTVRYLKVRITNGGEPPLEIGGATVYSVKETPAREATYAAVITGRTEDTANRASRLVIDLGSKGLPTHRLTIQTPQVNFYRAVTLEGSDDGQLWQGVLSSDVVYAYATSKFAGDQLAMGYPETTLRYLRLTINNGDDPPLTVTGVSARGIVRRVIFQAQPNADHTLYYGNPLARAPAYDLGRILPYLDTESLPVAQLAPQRDNPQFAVPQLPVSERLPWLIPSAVALAALAVALLLVGVLRQAKKLLPPSG